MSETIETNEVFENDFVNEEAVTTEAVTEEAPVTADAVTEEAPAAVVEVVATGTLVEEDEEDEEEDDDDFFAEEEAPAVPEIDPATIITFRTSAGSDKYVTAPASMPLVDAIAKSGLRFNGDFTCWLNGQEVALGTQVAGGMTVTVVGSVKGG
jgi:hypothetical protein